MSAPRVVGLCGLVEASCHCTEPEGHEGPHVCPCGGSWDFTDDGEFLFVSFPGVSTDWSAS